MNIKIQIGGIFWTIISAGLVLFKLANIGAPAHWGWLKVIGIIFLPPTVILCIIAIILLFILTSTIVKH